MEYYREYRIYLSIYLSIYTHTGSSHRAWEVGVSRCQLLHIEWINNKVLLYNTKNYIQYPVINHHGKKHEKECIYMYN